MVARGTEGHMRMCATGLSAACTDGRVTSAKNVHRRKGCASVSISLVILGPTAPVKWIGQLGFHHRYFGKEREFRFQRPWFRGKSRSSRYRSLVCIMFFICYGTASLLVRLYQDFVVCL